MVSQKREGKSVLIIVIILALLVVAGGGAYFLLMSKGKETAPVVEPNLPGPTVDFNDILVNLSDPAGNKYLDISLTLELENAKDLQAQVTQDTAKIKDIINTTLSSKTYDEIKTAQGKTALKQELTRRINTILTAGKVKEIYITKFLVQTIN